MNYTILQQNIMLQFETDFAQRAFLWASDRPDADRYLYKAEAYAREVEYLASQLEPMIDAAWNVLHNQQPNNPHLHWDDEVADDLLRFHLKRHAHWRFPDAKTDWL
jgi:hypothetical protein